MKAKWFPGALLTISLVAAVPSYAATAGTPDFGVSPKSINLIEILPCPPQGIVNVAAGKVCPAIPALERRDYEAVMHAQQRASAADKALAIADAAYPSLAQFARPIWTKLANEGGKGCSFPSEALGAKDDVALAAFLPKTTKLWKDTNGPLQSVISVAKKSFGRLRPFNANVPGLPKIDALVATDNLKTSPSYPSGHAAFASSTALFLSDIIPEHQDVLYARGIQYGLHREVVGVHFPTDVEAGETSGLIIAGVLLRNDDFRKEFEDARGELRKALCY